MAALAFTQIVGWGTTYYLPAILAPDFTAATGLPGRFVFGGITLMLLVAGLVAPSAGRRLGRDGVRRWMAAGSCGISAGLLLLAIASGPVLFGIGWIVIGLSTPFALSQGASTAIVQASDTNARRALTVMLLFSGLASTAFWPVLISLEAAIGLRWSLVAYAALHLCVCAPLHGFVLPARSGAPGSLNPAGPAGSAAKRPLPDGPGEAEPVRPLVFWLTATAFSLAGFISWGLPLHAIAVLEDYGHARSAAVAIGAVMGPGQLLARLIDILGGHRIDILIVGLMAAVLMPCAIVSVLIWGETQTAAILFVLAYGLSAGTLSLARAMAPLRLFGRTRFAAITGRLSAPQNVAFALSPVVFASMREAYGSAALLLTALGAALLSLAAMAALVRIAPARSGVPS